MQCLMYLLLFFSPLSCVQLFCDPVDSRLLGSSVRNSPGLSTGVGYHLLLLGIFPTRGLNLYLLHWQADFLPPSHQGACLIHGYI